MPTIDITDENENVIGTIEVSDELPEQLIESVVDAHKGPNVCQSRITYKNIQFGIYLIDRFDSENIELGILESGLFNTITSIMSPTIAALNQGLLDEAISCMRNIEESNKDGIYVTTSRLLLYVNLIEDFQMVNLSSELNPES